MSNPELDVAVQEGIRAALIGDAEITRLVGGRIYDSVPSPKERGQKVDFPYIVIGDDEIADDSNTCSDASRISSGVHVHSEELGKIEAKRIGGHVRRVLGTEINIDGHRTVVGVFDLAVYRKAPDGLRIEGVIAFTFLVDPL